jgi:nucleoside-triphosphatase THEP1
VTPGSQPPSASLHHLNPAWISAALLGSVWASVEIVLGSFLHNIRMPMAGTFLAAFGVCLLVAGSQIWNVKGLLWRTGVICALMKSISPSAVILGPMIGIVLEAAVLEASTRLIGKNLIGYLAGGALAASLPILQQITGVIAAKSFQWSSLGAIDIVLLLLLLTVLLGFAAAIVGLIAGRRARTLPSSGFSDAQTGPSVPFLSEDSDQQYSLPLLVSHVLLMPAGFAAVTYLPLWLSTVAVGLYLTYVIIRYPLARRKFTHRRLWIEFGVVSILAGYLLGELTSKSPGWSWSGLVIGVQMALRASLVIAAFSSISIELRNPVVIQWFLHRGLGQLSSALDIAFEALPAITDALGEGRRFVIRPVDSIAHLLATARDWLAARGQGGGPAVILLTGPQGSGKTGSVVSLAETLRRNGVSVRGVASVCLMDQGRRTGYDALDLSTGDRVALCRTDVPDQLLSAGQFSFFPEGFEFGFRVLLNNRHREHPDLVILDEVGPLELDGKGWAPALSEILAGDAQLLLLTVRPKLVDRVCRQWHLQPAALWDSERLDLAEATRALLNMTGRSGSPLTG